VLQCKALLGLRVVEHAKAEFFGLPLLWAFALCSFPKPTLPLASFLPEGAGRWDLGMFSAPKSEARVERAFSTASGGQDFEAFAMLQPLELASSLPGQAGGRRAQPAAVVIGEGFVVNAAVADDQDQAN
jgi:hypothetical protein